jgi:hypothetical protein
VVRTVKLIFPLPPAGAISFPLVRITTLGQSVYPDIALHIYYINIPFIGEIFFKSTKKTFHKINDFAEFISHDIMTTYYFYCEN